LIKIYESAITPSADVYSALSDDDYQINRCQILQVRGDDTRGIVTINAVFYLEEADLVTSPFLLGNIDEEILWPNSYTVAAGVDLLEECSKFKMPTEIRGLKPLVLLPICLTIGNTNQRLNAVMLLLLSGTLVLVQWVTSTSRTPILLIMWTNRLLVCITVRCVSITSWKGIIILR